jgi:serine/threonine-protein kinase
MEYVRGETLYDRILTEAPLPVGDVTHILHDVARAVHYTHTQGVIHRDLKPLDILIERESGRPYVADFGLARVMSESRLPGGGCTFGTFAYASPERAAGLPADHRSDIYALGVVGYVMATGQPLFTGTAKEVLRQHIATPAPLLPVLGLHLDATLARAVVAGSPEGGT